MCKVYYEFKIILGYHHKEGGGVICTCKNGRIDALPTFFFQLPTF